MVAETPGDENVVSGAVAAAEAEVVAAIDVRTELETGSS
jgi:hypothetical protein